MISIRTLSLPMLALVSVLAGCSAEQQSTAVTPDTATSNVAQNDTAATGDPAKGGPDGHRHGPGGPGGHGGPDFLIGAALHAPINLTADQRTTIEGLMKAGHPERPAFDATKAKALAAEVRAGNVTSQPPGPDQAKMQEHIAASATAIKTLHDTLTATQRTQLVDDVTSHFAQGGPGGPGGPAGDKSPGPRGDHAGPPHGGPGGFGGPLAQDLNLTQAQKDQLKSRIEANAPVKPTSEQMQQNMASMKAEMTQKLASFKSDSFDANAFVTPSAAMKARDPMTKGNPLQDLVSVLTPAQREQLAQKIEAGPPAAPQP